MKFSSLQHTGVKTFNVRDFTGGVNLYDLPQNIADNQLANGINVWHDGSVLTTRPGINSKTSDVMHIRTSFYEENDYFVTDTVFSVDGEYKHIAVKNVCYDDSDFFSYIYFVGMDKSLTDAGSMKFSRVTSDLFYKPSNMLFYVGAPVNGGGIFLLITMCNTNNSVDKYYAIYEIDAELKNWVRINDYYIPTVYINGRGTRYEEAKATHQAYTGVPTILESPNMLNGQFHAYLTSDGMSSCFRLPFSNLSGGCIVCRIYHTISDYVEWTVMSGKTSDTQSFFKSRVTLTVDREKGIIYFTDFEGEYPIPMMLLYHENNIRITAYKTIENGFENIVSSTCSTRFDSKIILSGGNNKNAVYCASFSNPLYFPLDSTIEVGEDDKPITALEIQGDSILAFKKSAIYSLKLTKGKPLDKNSLLADNDKIFLSPDSFSAEMTDSKIGCANKKTIAKCGKQTVWLANDGNVYTLKSVTSGEIFLLSKPIAPYIQKFDENQLMEAFALCKNRYYMLMIDGKALIMEYTVTELKCPKSSCNATSNDRIKWYLWSFNDNITVTDGFALDNKIKLLCVGRDKNVCYIASLDGEYDTDISLNGENATVKNEKIKSVISTKQFNLGDFSEKKNIQNIFLSLACKGTVNIEINGTKSDSFNLNSLYDNNSDEVLKSVRLMPSIHSSDSVYITLCSDEKISLGEMTVYYRRNN